MYNVCFIVASMDKRIQFLERCIDCFKRSRYSDCDIFLYFQGDNFDSVVGKEIFKEVVIDSQPRGVFTPRYELMKRFAIKYDYTIIIDDDLFILPGTDYFASIKFVSSMNNNVICSLSNRKVKNSIELDNTINIGGGLILPRKAVWVILDYFKDKEQDYTFDYFWLLCYVKGFDLYQDFRSKADHVPVRKVNGEYTGFNDSIVNKQFIPMLTEYFYNPGVTNIHGRIEPAFTFVKHITPLGKKERLEAKKKRGK